MCQEAEALDRTAVGLPGKQQALLEAVAATGTPIALVLMGGSSVSVPWAAQVMRATTERMFIEQ